jgi:hypothetical protein
MAAELAMVAAGIMAVTQPILQPGGLAEGIEAAGQRPVEMTPWKPLLRQRLPAWLLLQNLALPVPPVALGQRPAVLLRSKTMKLG